MQIDPRGQRVAAGITSVVLAIGLVTANAWVLGAQAAVFAIGALFGVRRSPYSLLYARTVRPFLGPPTELEDAAPPRFAQAVGLVFALVATLAFAAGLTLVGTVATSLALAAALLNAVFGFCLGCEVYLLVRRVTTRSSRTTESPNHQTAATEAASTEVPA
jgi:hypothetical protein